MARRRLLQGLALVVLLALLGAGLDYGYWALVEHRFVAVEDGLVFQSAEMPPARLIDVSRAHGIRAVIDLRDTQPEAVEAERDALAAAGIKHLHVPTPQEPDPQAVRALLDLMRDPRNRPVLVHCEHGEGRSVLMAALYRIDAQGRSSEAAWLASARLPPSLRFLADWFPGFASFDRDSPKGRILFTFAPPPAPGR